MVPARALVWATMLASFLAASATNPLKLYAQDQLGSINDYLNDDPDFPDADEFPVLGIGVINGNGRLKDGHPFDGAEIIYVVHGGPGAIAGLTGRGSRTEMLIIAGIMVASIFCPPVILVAGVLGSRMAEFDDFIVAVDGIRVHDVVELGEALNQAKSGEIVYLTTIRNGQRKQLQLELPRPRAGSSASPPTSEYLR